MWDMGREKLSTIVRGFGNKIKDNPFPSALIIIFLLLSILGLSGSSIGTFDQQVTGATPGLVLGQPRPVRSDEWLWQSQQLLIQKKNNYPATNQKIALGEDMSMVLDVPFRSIATFFKPQNLFFFFLPYANAFAARWWFMALVLCLGFFYLFDSLFPKKRLIAALGSLLILFNPFTQWWYQSVTLLTIGYALWMCFFIVKIFSDTISTKRLILYSAGLAYSSLCFIFLLYPSFLLSILYVIVAFLAGFFYWRYVVKRTSLVADKWRLLGTGSALFVVGLLSSIFFITHRPAITAMMNTVYPGNRNIVSGQSSSSSDGASFNILSTFSAPILVNLQNTKKALSFYTNQSEATRIVALNLLLLPIILFQILKKPRNKRTLVDYLLLSTSLLACLFIVRMFTPLLNLPFKILLFNKVQNERLAIGVTLLCVIQLVLMGINSTINLTMKKALLAGVVIFAILFDSSLVMAHRYPGFISGKEVLLVCLVISLSAFLLLQKKFFTLGLALFLLFNVAASAAINPLYHRSEPKSLQNMTDRLAATYKDSKNWVVFDSVTFEHVPLIAGEHSLSGLQYYPQLKLWHSLDPSSKAVQEYNRYSHVVFLTHDLPNGGTFYSPQSDILYVRFTCDLAKKLPNFGYALSPGPVDTQLASCLKEDSSMTYPNVTLRVYKYIPLPS